MDVILIIHENKSDPFLPDRLAWNENSNESREKGPLTVIDLHSRSVLEENRKSH